MGDEDGFASAVIGAIAVSTEAKARPATTACLEHLSFVNRWVIRLVPFSRPAQWAEQRFERCLGMASGARGHARGARALRDVVEGEGSLAGARMGRAQSHVAQVLRCPAPARIINA